MKARVHDHLRHYHREAHLNIGSVRSTLPITIFSLRCFRPAGFIESYYTTRVQALLRRHGRSCSVGVQGGGGGGKTGTEDADVLPGTYVVWESPGGGGGACACSSFTPLLTHVSYSRSPVAYACIAIPVTNHAQIRGVWQLQKVTVQYCKHSGSSVGVR